MMITDIHDITLNDMTLRLRITVPLMITDILFLFESNPRMCRISISITSSPKVKKAIFFFRGKETIASSNG